MSLEEKNMDEKDSIWMGKYRKNNTKGRAEDPDQNKYEEDVELSFNNEEVKEKNRYTNRNDICEKILEIWRHSGKKPNYIRKLEEDSKMKDEKKDGMELGLESTSPWNGMKNFKNDKEILDGAGKYKDRERCLFDLLDIQNNTTIEDRREIAPSNEYKNKTSSMEELRDWNLKYDLKDERLFEKMFDEKNEKLPFEIPEIREKTDGFQDTELMNLFGIFSDKYEKSEDKKNY